MSYDGYEINKGTRQKKKSVEIPHWVRPPPPPMTESVENLKKKN